jgi:hypothetical protein
MEDLEVDGLAVSINFLHRNVTLPNVLKVTSALFGILSIAGVPGTGIVQQLLKQLSGYVEGNVDKSGFEQVESTFKQVCVELQTIKDQLASQQKVMSQILGLVSDIRFKAGIEKIRGAYTALLKGTVTFFIQTFFIRDKVYT